jgi:hypothetical protein
MAAHEEPILCPERSSYLFVGFSAFFFGITNQGCEIDPLVVPEDIDSLLTISRLQVR